MCCLVVLMGFAVCFWVFDFVCFLCGFVGWCFLVQLDGASGFVGLPVFGDVLFASL